MNTPNRGLATVAVCLCASGSIAGPPATDWEEVVGALKARIADLEARDQHKTEVITSLQGEVRSLSNDDWLTEQRAAQIQAMVEDVLADADTRASLQADPQTAGWNKGFYVASADGNFLLKISGTLQFKWAYNRVRDTGLDSELWGFSNRRTALRFGGHVVDPSWKYFVQANFGASGGTFTLLDAYVDKTLGAGWRVRAGGFKLPFLREQLLPFNNLLAVERSLVADVFGVGRSQGVMAIYEQEHFRVGAALSDGLGAIGGTDVPALTADTDWSVTARIEGTVGEGDWLRYDDYTTWDGMNPGVYLGAAIHWEQSEFGTAAVESEVFRWTFDVETQFARTSIFAAVMGNHTNPTTGPGVDQYGVVIQAGTMIGEHWEPFARYEWADADGAGSNLSLLTVGFARYISGQRLKWTNDAGYAFEPVSVLFANTVKDWREDTAGASGQFVIRSQFQLLF